MAEGVADGVAVGVAVGVPDAAAEGSDSGSEELMLDMAHLLTRLTFRLRVILVARHSGVWGRVNARGWDGVIA